MDNGNTVMDDAKRKRLETRILRRTEHERTMLLKEEAFRQMASHLENAKTPVVVFSDYQLVYANHSALAATGYGYRQIKTFNNIELDTGGSKQRLEHVLRTAAGLGLHDLEFDTSIPTLDQKVLQMSPLMHRVVAGKEYWITELNGVKKIDPSTITKKVLGWLHRLFQRNAVCMNAPEMVYKSFAVKVIKEVVPDQNKNVLVDLSKTKYIDPEAFNILKDYSTHELFKNQLFMKISKPEQYYWLTFKKVPASNIYLPKGLELEGANA